MSRGGVRLNRPGKRFNDTGYQSRAGTLGDGSSFLGNWLAGIRLPSLDPRHAVSNVFHLSMEARMAIVLDGRRTAS
jgi:hypothetical protein